MPSVEHRQERVRHSGYDRLHGHVGYPRSTEQNRSIYNAERTVMQEQPTHCCEGDMCVEEVVELMKDHHKRETILPRHMCNIKFTLVLM